MEDYIDKALCAAKAYAKGRLFSIPEGCPPPYFVAAPTNKELEHAMARIAWPRFEAYGPFTAPDGRIITPATNLAVLTWRETQHLVNAQNQTEADGPHGTLFIVWPPSNTNIGFHKDRESMIEYAQSQPQWIVRDLPGG